MVGFLYNGGYFFFDAQESVSKSLLQWLPKFHSWIQALTSGVFTIMEYYVQYIVIGSRSFIVIMYILLYDYILFVYLSIF